MGYIAVSYIAINKNNGLPVATSNAGIASLIKVLQRDRHQPEDVWIYHIDIDTDGWIDAVNYYDFTSEYTKEVAKKVWDIN